MNDDPTQDLPNSDSPTDLVGLIQGLGAQLSALQAKVDERLYDTRPLWESVQGQINDLRFDTEQGFREARAFAEQGFRETRAEIQELRAESKADLEMLRTELNRELRHLSNTLDTLLGKLARFDSIQRDIENRVRDIESKAL
jgi:chromosome segregation ATPase